MSVEPSSPQPSYQSVFVILTGVRAVPVARRVHHNDFPTVLQDEPTGLHLYGHYIWIKKKKDEKIFALYGLRGTLLFCFCYCDRGGRPTSSSIPTRPDRHPCPARPCPAGERCAGRSPTAIKKLVGFSSPRARARTSVPASRVVHSRRDLIAYRPFVIPRCSVIGVQVPEGTLRDPSA